ncbi:MAG: ATP-binding protein [Desulfuromonadales bacterium]|nr:ATP-binding protein [Desulfuromonadales bacterium]
MIPNPFKLYGLKRKFGFVFATLTLLTTLFLTIVLYWNIRIEVRENLREHLQHIVDLATLILDADDHATLRTRDDIGNAAYERIKATFQRILKKANNTTYVYSMRQNDKGEIEFVIVVGNEAVPNASTGLLLGDVYENPGPIIVPVFSTFEQPMVAKDFNTDKWGTWLSGFAPIKTSDGSRDGVLGVDIAASEVIKQEQQILWVALTVFILIAPFASAVGWWLGCRLAAPILSLTEGANRISRGEFDQRVTVTSKDETFELAMAFNKMTEHLSETLKNLHNEIDMRRLAEDEVRQFNQKLEMRVTDRTRELELANREMEAFTYAVAHDLRAPLRTIHGFSEVLLEDYKDVLDDEGRLFLGYLQEGSREMDDLIEGLLRLASSTRGNIASQEVDLSAVVKGVADELKRKEPDRQLTIHIAPRQTCRADPKLIKVVMENLLGNAWKYTSGKADAFIEFGSCCEDGQSAFFVRDNGVGFDMAFSDKLFLPFHRLHQPEEFSGSGIGLATVQWLIHRHGGAVWAKSVVGEGSVFYFTLGKSD